MLESFTSGTFEPHIGDVFRLHVEGHPPVDTVLVEATRLRASPERARAPFSIVFRGPVEPVYPQRIYRLEHGGIGEFEVFLVPVGRDSDGVRYEAVFT